MKFIMHGFLSIVLFAVSAQATVKFCNHTGEKIWTAIAYYVGGECGHWDSEGWWPLDPGECAQVYSGDATGKRFYYTAHDAGRCHVWGGDTKFSVAECAFTRHDADKVGDHRRSFDNFVGDSCNETLNFNP